MEPRVSLIRLSKYAGICVAVMIWFHTTCEQTRHKISNQKMCRWLLNKAIEKLSVCKSRSSLCRALKLICLPCVQIGNRVLYMFFTHVRELFGDVVLKPVVRPLRWSNMATMPALPETQESIKEEIRRQVGPAAGVKFSSCS